MADDRYVFIVQWFDSAASLVRTYNFTIFLKDKSIEMFDIKNKRVFLKKCEYPNLQLKDVFVGAVLNVYSRQLKIIDFADEFTRSKFQVQRGKGVLVIKPDAYLNIGKVINQIEESGFSITNFKVARLNKSQAEKFYQNAKGQELSDLVNFITSDLIVAVEVLGQNCLSKLSQLAGNKNPKLARSENKESLRAKFGQNQIKNVVHVSDSAASAARQIEFFFSNKSTLQTPAYFNHCSCLVIKPHLLTQGYVGQIIDAVLTAGFQISAGQMFWLNRPSTEEFLEVYKGVVPEYNQMVEELTNGPCIALEVRHENVVPALRELCGPHDPQMARTVRPKSLRAIYGKDKAKNGVHCTDLVEDGILEVEYFFNILQKK